MTDSYGTLELFPISPSEGSPAKTSVSPDFRPDWLESDPGCSSSKGAERGYDPNLCDVNGDGFHAPPETPGGDLGPWPVVAAGADRPRCSDGDRRRKSEQVLVRFTPDELADAKTLAARHGLSVPELLRIGLNLLSASEMPR